VINTAATQGFSNPGFTWAATLGLVPILWSIANLQMTSSYLGGEIRNAQSFRRHFITMAGAAVVGTIQLALIAYLLIRTAGYNFLSSLVFSSSSFPSMASTYDFFVRILTPYMVFIDIGFFLMSFLLLSVNALIVQRSMFAWSFDRLVPTKLAAVSDRFHTPVICIAVSLLLAEVLIYLFAFTSATALYAASTFGLIITFTITAIAVGTYPYRHKTQFEASPVKYRVAGIPLMTVAAVLSLVFMAFMGYYFVSMPVLGGFSLITLYTVVILFVVSIAIFYGAKAYQRGKGIDISLEFKEIPPE
jgi:amino acid transporter